MSTSRPYDVAVIGGGYAGARVARDLRDLGVERVVILEARDRLGGRTLARPFPGTEQQIELGATWISPRLHTALAAEAERYGLEFAGPPPGPGPTMRWRLAGDGQPGGFPLTGDDLFELEAALYRLIDDAHRIDAAAVAPDLEGLADLDVSVHEYLCAIGARGRVYEFLALWGALGSGAPPEEWTALYALSLIASSGYSAYAWYGAVADKLVGGTPLLFEAMLSDAAAEVRRGARVTAVSHDDSVVRIAVDDGQELEARIAVVALPLNL